MSLDLRLTDDYDARFALNGNNNTYTIELEDTSSYVDFELNDYNLREIYDAIGEHLGLNPDPQVEVESKPNVLGVIEIVVRP